MGLWVFINSFPAAFSTKSIWAAANNACFQESEKHVQNKTNTEFLSDIFFKFSYCS